MRVGKSIQLVDAENAEHRDRQWVSPKDVEPKRDHEHGLNRPVQHKIYGDKVPGSGEVFSGLKQMVR